jgi:hypothetical protein
MSGEKSLNKSFPLDTEGTESEAGKAEQPQKQNAGTTNVVQSEPGLEALKELAEYVNTQCVRLWEQIVKSRQLIHHSNREVSRAIVGVVDDVCSDAQNEDSFYRCLMAFHVMASVLLGRTPRNEPICPLAMRLIEEETRKSLDQVRDRLKDIVNATLNRLDIAPERKSELERRAIEHIMEGKFYVDIVLERIKALVVQRMKPLDFRNFVMEAELNEYENKIMIHAIIPKAGEPADVTENLESFTIVSDLKRVGTAYLVGRDFEYVVSDLSRPEAVVLPPPPKEKGKEDSDLWAIGNFTVVIPEILRPALDRFLRMGWIPDGTTAEFLDAIRDKIKIIKTPEEMFRDTLARIFVGVHWVEVLKNETGGYALKSDIPVTPENPWQGYAYLLREPKRTNEGIEWLPTEIWVPYPLWQKMREILEKQKIPRNLIHAIVKSERVSRNATTCGSERAIRMRNLVILDIEMVKEYLNGEIEDYMVHIEPQCEGDGE